MIRALELIMEDMFHDNELGRATREKYLLSSLTNDFSV